MIIARKKTKITPKAVPVKAKKAPKKATKAKKPKKGKTLKEILTAWDAVSEDKEPPPSLYSVASRLDEHCNRLSEIKDLMDAALEDFFDLSDSRSTNLICLADRLLRDALKEAEGITNDAYRVNRNSLT